MKILSWPQTPGPPKEALRLYRIIQFDDQPNIKYYGYLNCMRLEDNFLCRRIQVYSSGFVGDGCLIVSMPLSLDVFRLTI